MILLFTYLIIISVIILPICSILAFYEKNKTVVNALMLLYFVLWTIWIIYLWIHLERAPFKTLGETRVWYSYLVPVVAWMLYIQNRWKWILAYGSSLAMIFILLNIFHSENFSKELMPALQSFWFAPHVLVYMFAYAIFGVATLIAFHYLWIKKQKNWNEFIETIRKLVYSGFAFLTLGLLFGAIWAKQAWGHYWTWDPKEVWALATWFSYLLYIHLSLLDKSKGEVNAIILISSFIILLLCWFGVNYLPVAGNSIHTY